MIISFGAIGIGLVWGWLVGLFEGRPRHTPLSIFSLSGGSAVSGGVVAWLAGTSEIVPFAVAAIAALWVHSQWRSELRKRYPNST